jgi:type II secretory pathway pseudopilin PulG
MPARAIRKYYLGLAVLMIVAIGAVIYTISQGTAAKSDAQTNKAVEQISNNLDGYITTSGKIPTSLAQAKITGIPPTVAYTKISDTKYKVCLDYKSSASGFDGGWTSLLGGFIGSGQSSTDNSNLQYFNNLVEFSHKKGENCQTVTPPNYSYPSLNNLQSTGPADSSPPVSSD